MRRMNLKVIIETFKDLNISEKGQIVPPLLVNQQNTQLNAKTKYQASNCHNFRVLGRLYSLILCGQPCTM